MKFTMQAPQEHPPKTENFPNTMKAVSNTRDLQHSSEEGRRLPLKLKSCSPLDGTSNLEFTNPSGKSCIPTSLANIRPNQHSYTLHKIHHTTTSLQKNQIKSPNRPREQEAPQRIHGILKEIYSADNEIFLYKIWPGNNRFYFDGMLMTGPKTDKLPNLAAWGLFLGLSGIYFGAALPLEEGVTLANLLAIYLFLSTIIFFFFTSFTDPGIIPRECVWELNGEVPKPYCAVQKKETNNNVSPSKNVEKFCTTCNISQPPRTIHCKDCGNCVEESRGHLRIFNNCIGKRNYQFFVGLITSMVLTILLYMISFIIFMIQSFQYDLKSSNGGIDNDTIDTVIGYLVGIPTVVFFLLKLSLFCNHFLIKARKRANQERKDQQGISFKDIRTDWCFSEPSKINPKQLISRAQLQKYKLNLIGGQNEA